MAEIKYIFWDWNGTIINDAPYALKIFNQLVVERGLSPLTYERYQAIYGHPIQAMYEKAGFNFSQEPFDRTTEEWHRRYVAGLAEVQLHSDARPVLEKIKAAGIIQSIVSSLPHTILCDSVKNHKVSEFFKEVCGLENFHAISKIDNAKSLLTRLGAPTANTLIIGDTTHDAEVALALGIQCILVNRGFEDKERLSRHDLPVVESLEEAASTFLKFNQL